MIKIIRDAIKATNDNIILAIPLIIFMWIIGAYLGYTMYSADSAVEITIAFVTIFFMLGAFLSGWFYMVKQAVKLSERVFVMDKDRIEATANLFKEFYAGIGRYFLSFIGMSVLFVLLFSFTAMLAYQIGINVIGDFDLSPTQMDLFLKTPEDAKQIVNSLSESQLVKLASWDLLLMCCSSVIIYLTFLWVPEVIHSVNNPFIALFTSIKKVLSKPLKTLILFIFIGITNLILTLLSSFVILNPIIYLIVKILYFYFLVFIVVLQFLFYRREFKSVEDNLPEKTKNDTEENNEAQ